MKHNQVFDTYGQPIDPCDYWFYYTQFRNLKAKESTTFVYFYKPQRRKNEADFEWELRDLDSPRCLWKQELLVLEKAFDQNLDIKSYSVRRLENCRLEKFFYGLLTLETEVNSFDLETEFKRINNLNFQVFSCIEDIPIKEWPDD